MNNNKTNTISAYVALQTNYADLISEDDRAEIARRFAEPFDPVDDAEVAAFFQNHGNPNAAR
mgnify:CR=1 FL=1